MPKELRIGVLISGSGSNLQAIIDACKNRQIDGKVVFVGSDTPGVLGLKRAADNFIPTFLVDYRSILREARNSDFKKKLPEDFDLPHILSVQSLFRAVYDKDRIATYFSIRAVAEAALLKEMSAFSYDLLVLAGFMRILTPYFIDRVNTDPSRPRIMNIHPALLPSFPGVDGYGDTFRYGCKVAGCTVHFVDYGEDTGPIIGQKAFDILPNDTLDSIRKKGLELEWKLYPACIQLFAQDRLTVVQHEYSLQNGTIYRKKAVQIGPPQTC
jgi:phosphoribosylglycinamide formyltransferase-1